MISSTLCELVHQFRSAIIAARDDRRFCNDIAFYNFPYACCGDASYLLAKYLKSKGVETVYVWGEKLDQSHAWLVVKDHRVKEPTPRFYEAPDNIKDILNLYSNDAYNEPINITHYEEDDLINGIIIDITADQFGEKPIYIDYMDEFHKRFIFVAAHDYRGLWDGRLRELYHTIMEYV